MKLPAGALGGILLVHKEAGMTSFDVVAQVRRLCGLRKVGHMGTLDPFATGLLPVAVGRSTGIIRYTEGYDKAYRVVIALGQATDTQDLTGTPVPRGGAPLTAAKMAAWLADDAAFLRQKIKDLQGDRLQVPPMYSAVKIKGEPLYKYARRGETVERRPRPITVYRAELVRVAQVDGPAPLQLTVDFQVSKGTYIRTLASDLGEDLGCGAHAAALIRTQCGPYFLQESSKLTDLKVKWESRSTGGDNGRSDGLLLSPETAVQHFPMLKLSLCEARDLLQGKRLKLARQQPGPRFRIISERGFVGVAKVIEGTEKDMLIGAERMFAKLDDYTF